MNLKPVDPAIVPAFLACIESAFEVGERGRYYEELIRPRAPLPDLTEAERRRRERKERRREERAALAVPAKVRAKAPPVDAEEERVRRVTAEHKRLAEIIQKRRDERSKVNREHR